MATNMEWSRSSNQITKFLEHSHFPYSYIWLAGSSRRERIDGKRERGRPRWQWQRDIRDTFDRSITEVGLWAFDRGRFRCAVEDMTSISG